MRSSITFNSLVGGCFFARYWEKGSVNGVISTDKQRKNSKGSS